VIEELENLRLGGSTGRPDPFSNFDPANVPLYAALSGIELDAPEFEIASGMTLRPVYVDMFGARMMAFRPPLNPKAIHPPPWAAVRGGFGHDCRVELSIHHCPDGFSGSRTAVLVASLLRLQVETPVRIPVIANMPFHKMADQCREVAAIAFEAAPNQFGSFRNRRSILNTADLEWLRDLFPTAARLYHDERFFRSFSVYEEAQWSSTVEVATALIWTAIETLFDLSGVQHKTQAISKALSQYVGDGPADIDRAYNVIREVYRKRGQVVHAGRSIESKDYLQTYQLARCAFRRLMIDGKLPASSCDAKH
jgi:hypothetical protein